MKFKEFLEQQSVVDMNGRPVQVGNKISWTVYGQTHTGTVTKVFDSDSGYNQAGDVYALLDKPDSPGRTVPVIASKATIISSTPTNKYRRTEI